MSSSPTSRQTVQAMEDRLSKLFQSSKERLQASEDLVSIAREYYVDRERLSSLEESHKRAQEQYTEDRTRLQTFLDGLTNLLSQEIQKRPGHFSWDEHQTLLSTQRAAEHLVGEKWPDGCSPTFVASTANAKAN